MYADGHCDYLYKLFNKKESIIDIDRLINAKVKLQNFAIFVKRQEPRKMIEETFTQLQMFYKLINQYQDVKVLLSKRSFDESAKLNAILSIEGSDIIYYDEKIFKTLWSLGIRIFGITWNNDNHFATSCYSKSTTGITEHGKSLINKISRLNGIIDISHISEQAFWDIVECTDANVGIVASHSNCRSICNNLRNLTDEQIKAIINRNGIIAINFVPEFLSTNYEVGTIDVMKHINKVIELGGIYNVAIGSDFDGAKVIDDINSPDLFEYLAINLKSLYNDKQVNNIMYYNWKRFLKNKLPD